MAKKNEQEMTPVNESLTRMEAFFNKNKKVIGITVAAVLVLIVGIFGYQKFISEPRANEASTAIASCQAYFEAEDYDKALNGDKANCVGFLKVIDEYGCTDAANLAKLYAGLSYAGLEKWQEAVKYLDDFSTQDDAMVSPSAIAALGNAYAHTNQLDKAIDALKKAAKMADGALETGHNDAISPIFLLQAAQILEEQGKTEDALKIYQDIKKNYLSSPLYRDIDKYIERCTK